MKRKEKRAVSPILATVILIAFTVAMGAIIVNWGGKLIEEQANDVSIKTERSVTCSIDLSLSILEIDNEKFICYNRSGSMNLEFIIENQGGASAEGVRVFLIDANDRTKTVDALTFLGSHNRTKYNMSINLTDEGVAFGLPPSKILISPVISVKGSTIDVCSDNRIDIEEVEECS